MSKINTWPGWTSVRKIGSGSYGTVYEIEKKEHGIIQKAALKVLSIPLSMYEVEDGYDNGDYSTFKEATGFYDSKIEDAIKEVTIMEKFHDELNIVHCDNYQVIPHQGWIGSDILIKMELLVPLSRYRSSHQIDEYAVQKIGVDISHALIACHNSVPQVLHRDIKPANILVDEKGNFKLADFGVARLVESSKTLHTIIGTEEYMAPEVIKGKGYRANADIYSLGLVLYKLLNSNRSPFLPVEGTLLPSMREEAKDKRIRGDKIPAPQYGSKKLQEIILKAIEYSPEDRWQTAEDFHNALLMCINDNSELSSDAVSETQVPVPEKQISVSEEQVPVSEEQESVSKKQEPASEKRERIRIPLLTLTDYSLRNRFIVNKSRFIIGRGDGLLVDGLIPSSHVSRTHCEILYSNGKYYIRDLGSMNGTFINQIKLPPHTIYPLFDNDNLKIAAFTYLVEISE